MITRCHWCDTPHDAGHGYWHLYRCAKRARAVLEKRAQPLDYEGVHGLLTARTRT